MTILPAGTFKVSDFRKPIPNRIKLFVLAREHEVDHDPALNARDYDTEAGDFIPPQNDPDYLVLRTVSQHLQKTTGRRDGAAKTVTTRGSDIGEAARIRDIRDSQAIHRAKIASKNGDYQRAAELLGSVKKKSKLKDKRTWPSRKLRSGSAVYASRER